MKSLYQQILGDTSQEVREHQTRIALWKQYYRGNADYIWTYEKNIDGKTRKRKRKALNAAKLVAQEMVSQVFSETPEVTGSDMLADVLERNAFWDHQAEAFEKQVAMGAQAIKVYVQGGELYLDYVPADRFIPVSWDNQRVTEAAFIDYRIIEGTQYARVESHKRYYPALTDEDGNPLVDETTGKTIRSSEPSGYLIESEMYRIEAGGSVKVDIRQYAPEASEAAILEIDNPPFVYIRNPVANNMASEAPLGVSVYGSALDSLEAADIAFDSMATAPELCRPRVLLSKEMVRYTVDPETGKQVKYFDPTDRVFQTAPFGDPDQDIPIKDMTIPLDHEPIRRQIQTELDILATQIGWTAGTLSFDSSGGVKTAREVISEDSKTYKTRAKYVNGLKAGYYQLFEVIQEIGRLYGLGVADDFEITWPDSIIEDRNTKAAYWQNMVAAGLVPAYRALMEIEGMGEEEAKRMTAEAAAEGGPTLPGA